jgi:hypothetical protein
VHSVDGMSDRQEGNSKDRGEVSTVSTFSTASAAPLRSFNKQLDDVTA